MLKFKAFCPYHKTSLRISDRVSQVLELPGEDLYQVASESFYCTGYLEDYRELEAKHYGYRAGATIQGENLWQVIEAFRVDRVELDKNCNPENWKYTALVASGEEVLFTSDGEIK